MRIGICEDDPGDLALLRDFLVELRENDSIACFGDAAMFSFHATKVFHSIEGGVAVFRDPAYYDALNRCKNFGINGETLETFGGNAKMNEFAAAMGLCNLRHLDAAVASRKEAAGRYRERLAGVPGIRLGAEQAGVKSNYAYFPAVFDPAVFGKTRDDVFEALSAHNITARKYFYPLTSSVAAFGGAHPAEKTPVAKFVSENVLCLPIYEGLGTENADRICDIIIGLR